jgi:hypothetical protein
MQHAEGSGWPVTLRVAFIKSLGVRWIVKGLYDPTRSASTPMRHR